MRRRDFIGQTALAFGAALLPRAASGAGRFDVIVYGGTASGVAAAVGAARQGARVALVEPGTHLGGMVSGGLGHTDTGRKETIGGISLEFFKRVGHHYGQPVTWDFGPHVAEDVFKAMAHEAGVRVIYRHRMKERGGASKTGSSITELITESGQRFPARAFIDATYEGDLLAQAGASFTWGREGREKYGESFAGVRAADRYAHHRFDVPVSAYGANGKLLPNIYPGPRGAIGAADKKVQAYNFRLCLTRDASNRVPMPKPSGYDPHDYAVLARLIAAMEKKGGPAPIITDFMIVSPLPNGKTDINNKGAFSTDYIGKSWDYPTAVYRRREQIWREHADYTAGFFYFLANDSSVPASLRDQVRPWGLAKDEFLDTHHWPYQLYVREARRLIGDFVMTQHDAETEITKPDPIGMGSYNMDAHNAQRYVQPDRTVQNEGDTEVPTIPYQISYRVLVPKMSECSNLLVPVCTSASHVGYGTLRLEPVYMIMGEAAGVAATIAADKGKPVQQIDTGKLTAELKKKGAVMEWSNPHGLKLKPVS